MSTADVLPVTKPTVEELRAQFPSLSQPIAFMENAGGSQLPGVVIDAVTSYLKLSFVQLGAPYPISQTATANAAEAHDFVLRQFGGEGIGYAVLGASSSILFQTLAQAYAPKLAERPEIIVAETGHEANVGPWTRIGATVKWWKVNPKTLRCEMEDLEALLSERTLLVAFPHVSNILGEVVDLAPIVEAAHEVGAKVVVDGVAYAPHRPMDVAGWNVDWYAFSNYKVYSPHAASLFGRFESFEGLVGPNHFFLRPDDLPSKFELGGVSHEAMAGIVGLQKYLCFAAGVQGDKADRQTITDAFGHFAELEIPLQALLVGYLANHPKVQIVGPSTAGQERIPTVSFLHESLSPEEISGQLAQQGFAMRHGHMYSYRLLDALGIPPTPGVARISLVHTNTLGEVEALIRALDQIL